MTSKSSKKRTYYSDSFKISVVQDVISSNLSKYTLCKKHSLTSPNTLRSWILFTPDFNLRETEMLKEPISENEEILALRRALQQKELKLKKEKMRADFYDEMINVAKKKFNIPIRKKACLLFGASKQAYYKHNDDSFEKASHARFIVEYVQSINLFRFNQGTGYCAS